MIALGTSEIIISYGLSPSPVMQPIIFKPAFEQWVMYLTGSTAPKLTTT